MLTVAKLRQIRDTAMAHQIPCHRVASQAEADEMTQNDPVGHVWAVGEEFYLLPDLQRTSHA